MSYQMLHPTKRVILLCKKATCQNSAMKLNNKKAGSMIKAINRTGTTNNYLNLFYDSDLLFPVKFWISRSSSII